MNDKKNYFIEHIEPIGKFIGTHGLAVFLVVYWTMNMYPDAKQERKEWIEGISELRNSIDPANRPISPQQAHVIVDFVSDSFIKELLTSTQQLNYSDTLRTNVHDSSVISFYIGKEKLTFDTSKPFSPQEKHLNKKLESYINNIKQETTILISGKIGDSIRKSKKQSGRLILFNYESSSLYSIWDSFLKRNKKWLKEALIEARTNEITYPVYQDYKLILEKHPDNNNLTIKLRSASISEIVDEFRLRIESHIFKKNVASIISNKQEK